MKIRKGSAIIVALLVMAILLTMTLSLSLLTVSEMRQTGDVVAAGKAYYAAEAGIENALLDLREHLPGYQTVGLDVADEFGWVKVEAADPGGADDGMLAYNYRIRNQGDRYPYFDEDKPVFLTPGVGITKSSLYGSNTWATYSVLSLNQTVTIPLFVACPNGIDYKDVTKFVLEYYVDFDTDKDKDSLLNFSAKLQDFDILRWKLFGEPSTAVGQGPTRTEAISDFYPARENDGPEDPVCIGSDPDLATAENCSFPVAQMVDISKENIETWDEFKGEDSYISDTANDISGIWSQARECTTSDAGEALAPADMSDGTAKNSIKKGCDILTFMKSHKKNYLTLTNVVNPDIVGISDPVLRAAKANIFYRLAAAKDVSSTCPTGAGDTLMNADNLMVRPAADISADGFALDRRVKQSIDAKLKLNSFLPVFNFTLYRTDPSVKNPEDVVAPSLFGGLKI